VGAAAGRQVESGDVDEAQHAVAAGRRLAQGQRGGFRGRDEADTHRPVAPDDLVGQRLGPLKLGRGQLGPVEVDGH